MALRTIRRPVIFNTFRPRSARFAERAVKATQSGNDFRDLSAMICWPAVIECARRAGAVSNKAARDMTARTQANSFHAYMPPSGMRIFDNAEWQTVPEGCFVALIADALAGGGQVLAHAVVSLGNGQVAGSNNGCIGGPNTWTAYSLTEKLTWQGEYLCHTVNGHTRRFELWVRDIEDREAPDCFVQ